MILAFDMRLSRHVPFNSAILQTIAHAVPQQVIRMYAHESRLAELQTDPLLTGNRQIEYHGIEISSHYRTQSQVVSVRRFLDEFKTLFRALQQAPRGEYCLVVLLVASSTAILASLLLAMTGWRRVGIVVCLHGDIASLTGWRSRNPVIRRFDMQGMLRRRHRQPIRYLVFEESVKQELGKLVPQTLAFTDVLPHPANVAEVAFCRDLALRYPVRIGIVGQATEAKGITPFLETAKLFKARYGERVEFYLVGRVFPGDDILRFAALDGPISTENISRDAFRDFLGRLHFVFLPLQPEYYRLSPSGALLDAITWLKPIIATSVPIVSDIFTHYGDIGYLCSGTADMQRALETVLTEMDALRYANQVKAMQRVREARLPAALAQELRTILTSHFPKLVAA